MPLYLCLRRVPFKQEPLLPTPVTTAMNYWDQHVVPAMKTAPGHHWAFHFAVSHQQRHFSSFYFICFFILLYLDNLYFAWSFNALKSKIDEQIKFCLNILPLQICECQLITELLLTACCVCMSVSLLSANSNYPLFLWNSIASRVLASSRIFSPLTPSYQSQHLICPNHN